jgi:hypothetical protein
MSTPLTAWQAPPVGRYALDLLTVKGRQAPLDLTVTDVATEGTSLVLRASGAVDRYTHGVTAVRGMAARHLSVEITARVTRA